MVKALFVRTKYDIQTEYLFYWSEELVTEAQKRGIKVTRVDGSKATPEQIQSYLKKVSPDFACLNGHGAPEVFYGHQNTEAIDASSVNLLKGTITFSRACDCAAKLGKQAIAEGCTAFIGYNKPFWVARTNELSSRPLKDPTAKPIFTASNTVAMHLLKGSTVEESVNASHQTSAKEIIKILSSPEPYASAPLRALIINDEALTALGNPKAKLTVS